MEDDLKPQTIDYDDEEQEPVVEHTDDSFYRSPLVARSRTKKIALKILKSKEKKRG